MARYKIALLIDTLSGIGGFQTSIWRGVTAYAAENDISIVTFCGGEVGNSPTNPYEKYRNIAYDLGDLADFNGFLFSGGTLGNRISHQEFVSFLKRYQSKPCVSVGSAADVYPEYMVDNASGMRAMIEHLVTQHSYTRIAFVKGTEGHEEADLRYETYKTVLKEHNIAFDENFIFQGNWTNESGNRAVVEFFEKRKVKPEVIACANDNMALGVMDELTKKGLNVPFDVAVCGFDNIEESAAIMPALTTINQPIGMLGAASCELLVSIIEGRPAKKINMLPAELKVRQSCGCVLPVLASSAMETDKAVTTVDAFDEAEINNAVQALTGSLQDLRTVPDRKTLEGLYLCFINETLKNKTGCFLESLDNCIRISFRAGENITNWQYAVSELRRLFFEHTADESSKTRASNLLHIARIYINELSVQLERKLRMEEKVQTEKIMNTAGRITASFSFSDLEKNFSTSLPEIDIPAAFLNIFDRSDSGKTTVYLRVFSDSRQEWDFAESERHYARTQLLPVSFFSRISRYSLIVHPLYFRDNQMGFLVFDQKSDIGDAYENITNQLHNTLQRIELLEDFEQAEARLKKKADAIETLLQPMMESIEYVRTLSEQQSREITAMNSRSAESQELLHASTEIASELAGITKETSSLVNAIDDIAETINLVALNASIEAAHAGNYGKGFAVIAGEIRKLSESSKSNSTRIAEFLTNIGQGIHSFSESNKNTDKAFGALVDQISAVTNSLGEVADRMNKMSRASEQVLEALRQ